MYRSALRAARGRQARRQAIGNRCQRRRELAGSVAHGAPNLDGFDELAALPVAFKFGEVG